MRAVSVVIVLALTFWMTVRYCWLTITGETDPVFSSWLVLTVSVGMSFSTYCKTKHYNLVDNIGVTSGAASVLFILVTVVLFGKNARAGFTSFEIGNLAFAALVAVYWWRTKNPFNANLAIQVLMVIGYIPMIARLLTASKNPEPWGVWISVWVACVFSMIPAYKPRPRTDGNPLTWRDTILPKITATRAIVSVTIILLLMLRLELK